MPTLGPNECEQLREATARRPARPPRVRRLTMAEYVEFTTQVSRMFPRRKAKPIIGGDHWKP